MNRKGIHLEEYGSAPSGTVPQVEISSEPITLDEPRAGTLIGKIKLTSKQRGFLKDTELEGCRTLHLIKADDGRVFIEPA